jgi:AcrR family transcriptional regulator
MAGERDIAEGTIAAALPRKPRAADRVSETANRLFYQRGIRAVGVDEIVAQAGVTKPSLYRSFPSKDDLIVSCLRARFDDIMAWWDAIEARLPGDPLAQLRALIAGIADETEEEQYRGCAATNAAVEFPEIAHPARLISMEFKVVIHDRLLALVSRLPADRPALLTDTLILLFEGARSIRHTSGGNGPCRSLAAAADAVLAAFLPPDTHPSGDPI